MTNFLFTPRLFLLELKYILRLNKHYLARCKMHTCSSQIQTERRKSGSHWKIHNDNKVIRKKTEKPGAKLSRF